MRFYILNIIIYAILVSCNNSELIDKSLPKLIRGKYDTINFIQNLRIDPDSIAHKYSSMIIIKNKLIIRDKWKPFQFLIYDIENDSYYRFGRYGRGPNEFRWPTIIKVASYQDSTISFYQTHNGRYYEYSLKNLLNSNDPLEPVNSTVLEINYMRVARFGKYYVGTGLFNKRFKVYPSNNEYLDYPFIETFSGIDSMFFAYHMQTNLVKRPDTNMLAVSTRKSLNIDLVRITEDSIVSIKKLHGNPPLIENISLPEGVLSASYKNENKNGFISMTTSKNYLYALYSGRSRIDNPDTFMSSRILLILNWEGEIIKRSRFKFDVNSIAVDENDKILYALYDNTNTDSIQVGKFEIDLD